MGRSDSAASVARLDGVGPSSDGRIMAHRDRPGEQDTVGAKRSIRPFKKPDLLRDDAYPSRPISRHP